MERFFRYDGCAEFSRGAVVMMIEYVFLHADKHITVQFEKNEEYQLLNNLLGQEDFATGDL